MRNRIVMAKLSRCCWSWRTTTGAGLSDVVQVPTTAWLRLEPQTRLSRVLCPETEQTTERQTAAAEQNSGAASSESNDE